MARELGHFSGGKIIAGTSGRFADVYDPNTGAMQARVALAGASEVEAVIANAAAAQPAWAATNPQRRARVLMKFLDLINQNVEALAQLLSSEHGKTVPDAKGDIQRGVEVLEFAIGIPHLLKGEYTESAGTGIDVYSMRQPLGVVAGITPFNFPAMIPLWKAAPAIACGNAFVLKPSERDPSVPLRLAELFAEAGGPAGYFQRRERRQGGRGRDSARPACYGGGICRLLSDRELYLCDGGAKRQARAVFRGRQEPRRYHAGCGYGPGGGRADRRRLRLRRRALHGDFRCRAGG